MEILNEIIAKVDAMKDDLIKQRRDIHRHPETGWTEFRTASLVAEKLSSYGYEVLMGEKAVKKDAMMGLPSDEALRNAQKRAVSEGANPDLVEKMTGGLTGVVGIFHFAKPGPVVALRCDMDCNDVTETSDEKHFPNQQGFSSTHEKEMHACGHDGHTTVGLAVAKILSEMKDELAGTFKIIFQPAEEGVRGAHAMAENGVVDDVDYLLGAHFGFKMKHTGDIACDVTGFLATTKFDAAFTGKPAHAGAAPEEGRNALLAAACAALNLHAIPRHSAGVSRINVGKLIAGSGRNVVGDKALIQLETRGSTTEINKFMEDEAARILNAAAAMYGVDVEIKKVGGAAGGSNSPELAAFLKDKAKEIGIFKNIVGECDFGASEDFSYFMEKVQSHGGQAAYMMVGAELAAGHHDSHFNFDETALAHSAKMMCYSLSQLLTSKK